MNIEQLKEEEKSLSELLNKNRYKQILQKISAKILNIGLQMYICSAKQVHGFIHLHTLF
jgi:hypothetical protein